MAGKRQFGSIRKLPSGRLQASYTGADGGRVNAPITFATKGDAGAWLANVQSDLTRGVLRKPTGDKRIFNEYAEEWLTSRPKPLAATTMESYQRSLRLYLLPTFGRLALTAIDPAQVRAWYGKLGKKVGHPTRAKAYGLLHAIMQTASVDEVITANPCKIEGGSHVESAERSPFNPDQVDMLAHLVIDRYRAMVLVNTYASLRHGELIGLRRCDIDLDMGTMDVNGQLQRIGGEWKRVPVKSRKGNRTLYLPAIVLDALTYHFTHYVGVDLESPVFTTDSGRPVHRQNWNRLLQRTGARMGFPDIHSHILRHSGLTLVAQTGATTRELMDFGGHSSVQVAMQYQHSAQQRMQELADKLDGLAKAPRQSVA